MIDTPPVTLSEIMASACSGRLVGAPMARVTGIKHDSRQVEEGDMFACLVGAHFDGHAFVGDAIARGASAVMVNADRSVEVPEDFPVLMVSDTRRVLPEAAAVIYGEPSRYLDVIGVTGTNGKSTTVSMCMSIGGAAGIPSGRIGTLGAHALGQDLPSMHTTPEADDLQRMLAQMRAMGVKLVAMEVSSHGLALHRTDATRFRAGVFTNLTQDHLDFHETLDAYFEAKLRLFRDYPAGHRTPFIAAINADDPRGQDVVESTRGDTLTFGLSDAASIRAQDVDAKPDRTAFTLVGIGQPVRIELPIGGSFQVYNALGAIAVCHGIGIPMPAIVEGLRAMQPVPGRFEAVPTGRDWDVIVDFAHTPDGLASLLASARALSPRRIILVMGCGGDRDASKRPIMGRIGADGADVLVVTSDNPRHENPAAIIDQIVAGTAGGRAQIMTEVERAAATELAMKLAEPGDLVLIAGKGGETYTIIGDERIPYDDRLVVRDILERLP